MRRLEKLEIIIKYHLAEKKRKRENSTHSSNLYLLELDSEISMLQKIMSEIDAIKRNHHTVTDEMILKMYGLNALVGNELN